MTRRDFYRNAAGFVLWIASIAKAKNYQHPRFEAFCKSVDSRYPSLKTSIVRDMLDLRPDSPGVAWFLATMGTVDHLHSQCDRIGGPSNLLVVSQQELLMGFWGSQASEYEELSWKNPEGHDGHFTGTFSAGTMLEVLEQKAVFVTRSGHVGYGPDGIQEGDEVCILPGCQYPILVRKKGQAYQVVGACVVYGIMGVDWTDHLKSGEVKLTDINLI
jgi:hypothetical protein